MNKNAKNQKSIRTSVSISAVDYRDLEKMAEKKKVTVAWIIREAVGEYLASDTPLFHSEWSEKQDAQSKP